MPLYHFAINAMGTTIVVCKTTPICPISFTDLIGWMVIGWLIHPGTCVPLSQSMRLYCGCSGLIFYDSILLIGYYTSSVGMTDALLYHDWLAPSVARVGQSDNTNK